MHPRLSSDHSPQAPLWLPLAYLSVSLLLGSGAMHFAGPQLRQHAANLQAHLAVTTPPQPVRLAGVPLRASHAGA